LDDPTLERERLSPRAHWSRHPDRECGKLSGPETAGLSGAQALQASEAKDLLYIHDTLLIFAHNLKELGALWKGIEPGIHPNTRQALARRRASIFTRVMDPARDAAVMAASTSRSVPPSADRLLATCRAGLARVFG